MEMPPDTLKAVGVNELFVTVVVETSFTTEQSASGSLGVLKDVLNSLGNYFFWNEHLNSTSLERVGGCPHNLSSS